MQELCCQVRILSGEFANPLISRQNRTVFLKIGLDFTLFFVYNRVYEVRGRMKCAYCGCTQSRVVDSRQSEDGTSIRRRRECENCGRRFTTYERIDLVPLMVIKKDQTREAFDVEKLRSGIVKACEKRPVSLNRIDELVRDIEQKLNNHPDSEITSQMVGELVMDGLKNLDEVAYVRFASVYRQFRDIQTFRDELNKLLADFNPGTTDGESVR